MCLSCVQTAMFATRIRRHSAFDTSTKGLPSFLLGKSVRGTQDDSMKMAVLISYIFCGFVATAWATCYFLLTAWWSSLFPLVMALLCFGAAAHLFLTGELTFARKGLCTGLAIASLGVHWSFGGSVNSYGVVNWAFLGPQVLIITGYVVSCTRECHRSYWVGGFIDVHRILVSVLSFLRE